MLKSNQMFVSSPWKFWKNGYSVQRGTFWNCLKIMCVCESNFFAYILIGPGGGRALAGNAHTGALFAAAPIVTLKIVEPQLAAVAVFPFHVFLQEWNADGGEMCKVYRWCAHSGRYWAANVLKTMMGLGTLRRSTLQRSGRCAGMNVFTLHRQGDIHGSSFVLPSMLQLQRRQTGKPI